MVSSDERKLLDKLRKIEALFARAGTHGEEVAAGEARKRIKEKLALIAKTEKATEYRFSIHDPWSRQLFAALCRRYNLTPYRLPNQRATSIMIKVPESFVRDVLMPEYQALNKELYIYLEQMTKKIIKEAICKDTTEPQMAS